MRHAGGHFAQGDELGRLGNGLPGLMTQRLVVPHQDRALADLRQRPVRQREMEIVRGFAGPDDLEIDLDAACVLAGGEGEDGGGAVHGLVAQDVAGLVVASDELAKAIVAVDHLPLLVEHRAQRRRRVDQGRQQPPLRGQSRRRFVAGAQAQDLGGDENRDGAQQQSPG